MREITRRDGFLSGATWLLVFRAPAGRHVEYCGTVQGCATPRITARSRIGDQPSHRSEDVGRCSCTGRSAAFGGGIAASHLEVTAQNPERSGSIIVWIRTVRTVYKAAEVPTRRQRSLGNLSASKVSLVTEEILVDSSIRSRARDGTDAVARVRRVYAPGSRGARATRHLLGWGIWFAKWCSEAAVLAAAGSYRNWRCWA